MATSTILDMVGTLNGLAKTTNLGGLAAANAWAGTTNMGLIAALNIKAGNGADPKNWRGLNGVCNQLAGTTNLEALQALQLLLIAGGGGGGGGNEDYMLIATFVAAGGETTANFDAIPQTYKHLKLVGSLSSVSSVGAVTIEFNDDTTAGHYDDDYSQGVNTGSMTGVHNTSTLIGGTGEYFYHADSGIGACAFDITIPNYTSTFGKRLSGLWMAGDIASSASITAVAGLWNGGAAITEIDFLFTQALAAGSIVSLYGLS